jgi:hypothetical protein
MIGAECPRRLTCRIRNGCGASVAKQWPSAESVPSRRNQTQSDAIRGSPVDASQSRVRTAIRRNQTQSDAIRGSPVDASQSRVRTDPPAV